ncbi:MAG: hypothetical protein HC845_13095 [Akkermansiaceae bacterium]|nr:hypothetical protein [Akkermansiaceae bacterium]
MIATASLGFTGWFGKLLENPKIQRIGQLSYGLYLFHNLAPLVAGKLLWFLWDDRFVNDLGSMIKVVAYAVIAWVLTLASWYFIEQPLQNVRAKMAPR